MPRKSHHRCLPSEARHIVDPLMRKTSSSRSCTVAKMGTSLSGPCSTHSTSCGHPNTVRSADCVVNTSSHGSLFLSGSKQRYIHT